MWICFFAPLYYYADIHIITYHSMFFLKLLSSILMNSHLLIHCIDKCISGFCLAVIPCKYKHSIQFYFRSSRVLAENYTSDRIASSSSSSTVCLPVPCRRSILNEPAEIGVFFVWSFCVVDCTLYCKTCSSLNSWKTHLFTPIYHLSQFYKLCILAV